LRSVFLTIMGWRPLKFWVFSPGGARFSSLGVANDEMIPVQYQGIVVVRLNSRLGVENSLIEQSPKADAPEGSYIARTLVRDRR
jgi:hypothetical protein